MARKIILKENGLLGSSNTPTGYRYIGYDGTTPSEKSGATVSALGGGLYTTSQVSITPNQIKSMNTSPVELIPSPGAGKIIIVENVTVGMSGGTASYDGPEGMYGMVVTYGNNPAQTYGDPASIFAGIFIATGTLTQAVQIQYSPVLSDVSSTAIAFGDDIFFNLAPLAGILGNAPALLFPNLGVYLTTNGNSNLTDGNVLVTVYLTYRILTV